MNDETIYLGPDVTDMTGWVFGRLTVLRPVSRTPKHDTRWECRCACGQIKIIVGGLLRSGRTSSCGCLRREASAKRKYVHGMTGARVYKSWTGMRDRCLSGGSSKWKYYGGRGITICERWESFENFYADMGDPPEGMSLDRIDNDKGYSSENCRWSTKTEQARNRQSSRIYTFGGMTLSVSGWAEHLGIRVSVLHHRIMRGESPPRLFRAPR